MKKLMATSLLTLATAVTLLACETVEIGAATRAEADTATELTATELNPTKRSESLLDHDGKVDCTSQVFTADSKALCK